MVNNEIGADSVAASAGGGVADHFAVPLTRIRYKTGGQGWPSNRKPILRAKKASCFLEHNLFGYINRLNAIRGMSAEGESPACNGQRARPG
jgi:hypothetical protein